MDNKIAQVDVTLNTSKAEKQYDSLRKHIERQKIKLQIDPDSFNFNVLKNNPAYKKSIQNASKAISESINSPKTKISPAVEQKSPSETSAKASPSAAPAQVASEKSLLNSLKQSVTNAAKFTGIYTTIANIPKNLPRQMVQAVYDIDTAMSSLYRTTDETAGIYNAFLDNAGAKSKAVGRDMINYIEQTAKWSKLGYSLGEADKLSEVSSIYANVGGVSDSTAMSDIEAAMKTYNINAQEALKIADSYSALGTKFTTSAAEIGKGISNVGSLLAAAGNDFDQSASMIAVMSEITHSTGEADKVLKDLSMHLRGYNEDTQSYSNDINEFSRSIAALTKTAATPGGISLFTDETKESYKSAYQIIQEISQIWDNLTTKNKTQLTEVLAGKDSSSHISALIQAFQSGKMNEAYNTSINSEGSAMKEQERWLELMDAKVQQFQASFQELSNTVVSSDFIKILIDTGSQFLNVLTDIIDNIGVLQTLIGGFTAFKGLKSFTKNFDNSAEKSGEFKKYSPIFLNWSIIVEEVA